MRNTREQVIKALENPDFQWRTLDGISRETGLSQIEILQVFQEIEGQLLRSAEPDKHGKTVYTTRRHYYSTQGFFTRSLTAATGSIK